MGLEVMIGSLLCVMQHSFKLIDELMLGLDTRVTEQPVCLTVSEPDVQRHATYGWQRTVPCLELRAGPLPHDPSFLVHVGPHTYQLVSNRSARKPIVIGVDVLAAD